MRRRVRRKRRRVRKRLEKERVVKGSRESVGWRGEGGCSGLWRMCTRLGRA